MHLSDISASMLLQMPACRRRYGQRLCRFLKPPAAVAAAARQSAHQAWSLARRRPSSWTLRRKTRLRTRPSPGAGACTRV